MVLLSTHNIGFGWEIRKLNFKYALLSWGMQKSSINTHNMLTYLAGLDVLMLVWVFIYIQFWCMQAGFSFDFFAWETSYPPKV